MTSNEIVRRIIDDHNRLAEAFASGGIILRNADCVIVMGDVLRDLRALVQQLQTEVSEKQEAPEKE